jgi:hypothetical protein
MSSLLTKKLNHVELFNKNKKGKLIRETGNLRKYKMNKKSSKRFAERYP